LTPFPPRINLPHCCIFDISNANLPIAEELRAHGDVDLSRFLAEPRELWDGETCLAYCCVAGASTLWETPNGAFGAGLAQVNEYIQVRGFRIALFVCLLVCLVGCVFLFV
jgi:hypothetical protein